MDRDIAEWEPILKSLKDKGVLILQQSKDYLEIHINLDAVAPQE
jgi:hypothetical protein